MCSRLKRVYFLSFKIQEKLSMSSQKSSPLYAVYGGPVELGPSINAVEPIHLLSLPN
jgi:hypothetical protein